MQTKVFTFWSARSNHGQTLVKVSSPFANLFPNLRQYERWFDTHLSLSVCVGSSCGMLLSPAPMTLSGLATKCNHIDMKCSRGRTKS